MTVTTKKFLTDQLKLIMSLTDEQVNIYTRETMFKVVEDLSGGICWASSHKIDDTGALLTPQAFLKWSEHPEKTLTSVIGMKVKGGKSLTTECEDLKFFSLSGFKGLLFFGSVICIVYLQHLFFESC